MTTHLLDGAIEPDGGLYNLGWYLAWKPGQENATLDGMFDAAQLRAIADWMNSHQPSAAEVLKTR